jgi:hypothetical protein
MLATSQDQPSDVATTFSTISRGVIVGPDSTLRGSTSP